MDNTRWRFRHKQYAEGLGAEPARATSWIVAQALEARKRAGLPEKADD